MKALNYDPRKTLDCFEESFVSEAAMIDSVKEEAECSEWISGIPSKELRLEEMLPIQVYDLAPKYGFDVGMAMETASESEGTQLVLSYCGKGMLVRKCAKQSLSDTAKLNGSALTRMTPAAYSETLNYGFDVAKGNSLLLMRYGKLASCHSDSEGGYEIMPIPTLLDKVREMMSSRFGAAHFEEGYHSHSYMSALWTLPDAKSRLLDQYQDALDAAGSQSACQITFTPALRFSTSDTSNACATLVPVWQISNDRTLQLCEGIKVKHQRKPGEKSRMEAFSDEIQNIFAKFEESAKKVEELAQITVAYPENAVVSICKKYNIPKKYGAAALEEVKLFSNGGMLSAHDLYLAMSAIPAEAKLKNASRFTVDTMNEILVKVLQTVNWHEHDVPGTVAWKD